MCIILCLFGILLVSMIGRGGYYSKERLVLFELYCSIAILVLGVAPAAWYLIEEQVPPEQLLNQMPINPGHYFGYALPLLMAICLGALSWGTHESRSDQGLLVQIIKQIEVQPYLPFLLLGLGFAAQVLIPYLPATLRQVGHFGSILRWVGAIHLLFWPGNKWLKSGIYLCLFLYLIYQALSTSFFGDLMLWPLWIALYAQLRFRWSLRALIISGLVLLGPLLFLNSFKYAYRSQIWEKEKLSFASKIKAFKEAVHLQAEQPLTSSGWQSVLVRFNQGQHLAQVYAWVPRHEPYARGETLLTAIAASAVPRLFWPDKPGAGGEKIWYRFTGNKLLVSSMNIGIGGEAYANFGPWLAALVVFGYVSGLRWIYLGMRQLALRWYPALWLWMPLIFAGLIDQENDFITQLNYGVKGIAFTLAMCWTLHKLCRYLWQSSGQK